MKAFYRRICLGSVFLVWGALLGALLLHAQPNTGQTTKEETVVDVNVDPNQSTKVELLSQVINTHHTEYTPFITPDEKYLIFESNRPGSVGDYGDFDLWIAENKAGENEKPNFSYPVNMGEPVNSKHFDGLPSLRTNERGNLELYFTSFASNVRKGPDLTNIYYSERVEGKWSIPLPVENINSNFNDRMPSISADGNRLYFSSDRPGGFGKDDIWVSNYDREKRQWLEPVNLGPQINSASSEISPSIHNDTVTLYFSSDRKGGLGNYDIYVTQHNSESEQKWATPKNLGAPYNSSEDDEYPTVTSNGKYMYFSSNRPGGYGGFDIYRAEIPEFARPKVVVKITGRVHEETSLKGIEANIRIEGLEGFRNITTQLPTGKYEMELINDHVYKLTISAPGFITRTEEINLKDLFKLNQTLNFNYALSRIFYIPENLTVNMIFRNERKDLLTPKLSFAETQGINFLNEEKTSLAVEVPAEITNKLDFESFLRQKTIPIKAEVDDYPAADFAIELNNLFKEPYQTKKAEVEFILRKQVVDHTKKEVTPVAGTKKIATILFPLNEAIFYKSQKAIAEKAIAEIKKENYSVIEIHGHTDASGTQKENEDLSKRRAEHLKKLLEQNGIKTDTINVFWHAHRDPAVKTQKNRVVLENRRVEIFAKK